MKKILSVLSIIITCSSLLCAYTVRSTHPRIYINSDNISDVRARCTGPGTLQSDYYKEMKKLVDHSYTNATRHRNTRQLKAYEMLYLL